MKYKVGAVVRILGGGSSASFVGGILFWSSEMNQYIGKVGHVVRVTIANHYRVIFDDGQVWTFLEEWLQPVVIKKFVHIKEDVDTAWLIISQDKHVMSCWINEDFAQGMKETLDRTTELLKMEFED